MKRLAALVLVASALLLSACSSINAGTITRKDAIPGQYTTTQSCISYNKDGVCSQWVPITSYDPPRWIFYITEGEDNGWVYVAEETYSTYEIGDYYDPESGRGSSSR